MNKYNASPTIDYCFIIFIWKAQRKIFYPYDIHTFASMSLSALVAELRAGIKI